MTIGSRRACSIGCHPVQLLFPLLPLLSASSALQSGGRWKTLCRAGQGIRSMCIPLPSHHWENAFPYKHAVANTLFSFGGLVLVSLRTAFSPSSKTTKLLEYLEASQSVAYSIRDWHCCLVAMAAFPIMLTSSMGEHEGDRVNPLFPDTRTSPALCLPRLKCETCSRVI